MSGDRAACAVALHRVGAPRGIAARRPDRGTEGEAVGAGRATLPLGGFAPPEPVRRRAPPEPVLAVRAAGAQCTARPIPRGNDGHGTDDPQPQGDGGRARPRSAAGCRVRPCRAGARAAQSVCRGEGGGPLVGSPAVFGMPPTKRRGGVTGPALDAVGARLSASAIRSVVDAPQAARPGSAMPRVPMSGATLDLVVRYLASRTGAAGGAGATDTAVRAGTTVAQPGDGAGLYATSCATCHGAQGGGDGHNAEYLPVPPPPHTSSEYQETHLASDCYVNGRMTCTDCHDPHSQTYRDAFGRPLAGRFDDGQCTACHPSKAERPATHTHHPVASPGSNCVACHMPYLQHPASGAPSRLAARTTPSRFRGPRSTRRSGSWGPARSATAIDPSSNWTATSRRGGVSPSRWLPERGP